MSIPRNSPLELDSMVWEEWNILAPTITKPPAKLLISHSDLSFPKKFLRIKGKKLEWDFTITKMMLSEETEMMATIPMTPTIEVDREVPDTKITETRINWTSIQILLTLPLPTEMNSTSSTSRKMSNWNKLEHKFQGKRSKNIKTILTLKSKSEILEANHRNSQDKLRISPMEDRVIESVLLMNLITEILITEMVEMVIKIMMIPTVVTTVVLVMVEAETAKRTESQKINRDTKSWETTMLQEDQPRRKLFLFPSTVALTILTNTALSTPSLTETEEETEDNTLNKLLNKMMSRSTEGKSRLYMLNPGFRTTKSLKKIEDTMVDRRIPDSSPTEAEKEKRPILVVDTTSWRNTLENKREIIMIMAFILTSAQIVMVSTAEPAELPFLLSTDLSGIKMKALRWLSSTRKESETSVNVRESKEVIARIVATLVQRFQRETEDPKEEEGDYDLECIWIFIHIILIAFTCSYASAEEAPFGDTLSPL